VQGVVQVFQVPLFLMSSDDRPGFCKTDKRIKTVVKPSGTLFPNPAALITSRGKGDGRENIFTAAWVSTVSMEPPHVGVAIRPIRFSFGLIVESGQFGVNLPATDMVEMVDLCGNTSGRETDKWALTGFTKLKPSVISVPLVRECPVNLECRVVEKIEVGTHFWIIGEVVARHEDEGFSPRELLSYVSPEYRGIGDKKLGFYGFSKRQAP